MIRDVLIPELAERFPGRGLRTASPPNPLATFPAVNETVGDVRIWQDGDEVRVAIGTITHGHFSLHDATMSRDQIANQIVADVVGFLDDLFADRVLLWQSPDGRSGGWRVLGRDENLSPVGSENQAFIWSGPIRTR
jgi:hypothetical protein